MRAPSDSDLLDAARTRRDTNRHIPPFVTTYSAQGRYDGKWHFVNTMSRFKIGVPLTSGGDHGTLRLIQNSSATLVTGLSY